MNKISKFDTKFHEISIFSWVAGFAQNGKCEYEFDFKTFVCCCGCWTEPELSFSLGPILQNFFGVAINAEKYPRVDFDVGNNVVN